MFETGKTNNSTKVLIVDDLNLSQLCKKSSAMLHNGQGWRSSDSSISSARTGVDFLFKAQDKNF